MKQEKKVLEIHNGHIKTQYENLINSLRHAYDKIHLEETKTDIALKLSSQIFKV